MKVLGGPKEGDFYNHRGFRGVIGERLHDTPIVAERIAQLAPVAEVMAQEAAAEQQNIAELIPAPAQAVQVPAVESINA